MYIKREVNIVITDEERETLKKALEILIAFEDESSSADETILQEMYDEYTHCVDHQMALPTAVDLLSVIVGDDDL